VSLQVKAFYYDETNFPKSSAPAKDAVHGWFTATTYHRGLYYLVKNGGLQAILREF
jgi:hypothetical protein